MGKTIELLLFKCSKCETEFMILAKPHKGNCIECEESYEIVEIEVKG